MKQYMIDTSVWIDYFRNVDKALNDFIDRLIDEDSVYIDGIIKSEILIGTRTQKEYDLVKNNLKCLHNLPLDDEIFNKVSESGYKLKRKGITVPLTDLIIAAQCSHHRLILIEKDRHYEKIKECLEFEIYSSLKNNDQMK